MATTPSTPTDAPLPAAAPLIDRAAHGEHRAAWIEALLLVLVLAALAWQYQGLRADDAPSPARQRLLLDQALQAGPVATIRPGLLAALCQRSDLPPRLRWHWASACAGSGPAVPTPWAQMPVALAGELKSLQAALAAGEARRLAEIMPLARSRAEGVLSAAESARLGAAIEALSIYRARHLLRADSAGAGTGSLLLQCAAAELTQRHRQADSDPQRAVLLANHLAMLRGTPQRLWWPPDLSALGSASGATASRAARAAAPDWSAGNAAACAALGSPLQAVADASAAVQQLRQGDRLAAKSRAMQTLQARAPWLLAGWSLLAWSLLALARRTLRPVRFLPVAGVAWAAMGALSGLAPGDTGRVLPLWLWGAVALASLVLAWLGRLPRVERLALWAPGPAQERASLVTLPLVVLFLGLGWWLVFDLALNGHERNRYIALAQAPAVFGALALLSTLPVLAHGLARIWLRWSGLVTLALQPRTGAGWRGWARPLILWAIYAIVLLGLAWGLRHWRQFTGVAFRWWLLIGVAWFFMLRAARWTVSAGLGWRRWLISLLPLLVHVVLVLGALVVTDDLGPILVVLLAGAIYLGAFGAQAIRPRARWPAKAALGVAMTLALGGALVGALYGLGQAPWAPQRVTERLESMLQPFSADNDQLAHVLWFREHLPPAGHGLGDVPWCGTLPDRSCQGMPVQTQSDYSFTAMQGVLGPAGALALLLAYALCLALLAVRHAAQTPGRLTLGAGTPAAAAAWLAWLALCWAVLVLVQTLVTVSGNLGALPLTGVTWPLLSFGTWSTLGQAFFLGLLIHRLKVAS